MNNDNLPAGWDNKSNNIPKAWDKSDKTPNEGIGKTANDQGALQDEKHSGSISEQPNNNTNINEKVNLDEQKPTISKKTAETEQKGLLDSNTINQPSTGKSPKTIRVSTAVLLISLIVVIAALVVFIVLFFSGKNDNDTEVTNTISYTETTSNETVTTTESVTENTLNETSAKPTDAPKTTESPTTIINSEENQKSNSFKEYTVWINKYVIIYERPYPRSGMTGEIEESTYYTIVEESKDEYGDVWGKLKSGIGWVNLSTLETAGNGWEAYEARDKSSSPFSDYLIWLDSGVQVYESPDVYSNVTYVIDISTKYTIVDEAYDSNGNKWGKLKSGVGWVMI